MKNKGQLIITDLLLYTIIITLIIGVIIGFTQHINEKQSTTINHHETDKIAQNTIDTLTNSPGKPTTWNEKISDETIIGLKMTENNTKLSYKKIVKLKENPELLKQLIPDNINYELLLENTTNTIHIAENIKDSNKTNIYVKQKPVKIDYNLNITSITSDKNITCPLHHTRNYNCISYILNQEDLKNGNYYLLSNTSDDYIITNTYDDELHIKSTDKPVNQDLSKLIRNTNQTIYIHTENNNNSYLVYDTNNIKPTYNMINGENYILKLKIY